MARIPPLTHHRTPRRILRAKCQVVRERDFRLVADQVVDLSPTGALVMPADPVLTGEAVLISFKLPHIPYWLDAEAIVARVVHGRRPGEHTRGLALTFQRLSGISRYMIEQSLRYLPPAPPSFRAGRRENASILSHLVGSHAWSPRPLPRGNAGFANAPVSW
jgi:hypothetical protein